MAYTDPYDYTPGQVLTAANLDTYLSDNMRATAVGVVTTAGDTVYATGANALARLALGTAGHLLQAGAAAPQWVSMLAALGAQFQYVAATVTATSDTLTAKTGGPAVTVVAPASGNILVMLAADMYNDLLNAFATMSVHDGVADCNDEIYVIKNAGNDESLASSHMKVGVVTGYTPGASVTLTVRYARSDGGTAGFLRRALFAMPL